MSDFLDDFISNYDDEGVSIADRCVEEYLKAHSLDDDLNDEWIKEWFHELSIGDQEFYGMDVAVFQKVIRILLKEKQFF